VLVLNQRGRLHGSQAWVELHYGIVFEVDEGLIRRLQIYGTAEEAIEAVGLGSRLCRTKMPEGHVTPREPLGR
jgi:hypothetical protein